MRETSLVYDVIVVGARCAGAALAMLLARKGRRVLAVDRAVFPSDTISTHFLWPRTTSFLANWGLLDAVAETGCPPIHSVRLHWGRVVVEGRPEPVDGTAEMYCPRRTVLDALLVEAARGAGAEVRERTVVRDLLITNGRVMGIVATGPDGDTYSERATVTVGADGLFSRVANIVQARMARSHPSMTCGFYAYWDDVPTDGVDFYLRDGRDILIFPTHEGRTCIWVGRPNCEWPAYRADIEGGYLEGLDAGILERVRKGRRATPFKGTNKLPNFYRDSHGEGWALVGDAAYHRDPLTGMGIGDAFLGAQMLADALDARLDDDVSLAGYQRAFREKTEAVFDYTLQSASLRDPSSQVNLYREIAQRPDLTQCLMNVLAGSQQARGLFNSKNVARIVAARH